MGILNTVKIGIKKDTINRLESELLEYQQLNDYQQQEQYQQRIDFLEDEIEKENEKLEELQNWDWLIKKEYSLKWDWKEYTA